MKPQKVQWQCVIRLKYTTTVQLGSIIYILSQIPPRKKMNVIEFLKTNS
jgi:hypothetical protein